jgi:MOSC domain-containing protein YiiM
MRVTAGRLVSINISRGGVPKTAVFEALTTVGGVDGDRHRYPNHGGLDRAVVLYSLDVIESLQREGHPIAVGTTGENLTLAGLDWPSIAPGSEVRIGAVRLQITSYTTPCGSIARSFVGGDIARIAQKQHPGWSRVCARVVTEGIVRTDDAVSVVFTESTTPSSSLGP